LFAAAPDWRIEIENVLDDGDRQAVVQWRGSGTFDGEPFQGIAPTGRRIELRGVDAVRFDADGKVEENTIYYDGAEFARQVGMLPPRGSGAYRAMSRRSTRPRV
jgi:predicted ester cyclase